MDLPLDQRIDAAHAQAERTEAEARQIEARIVQAGGLPPKRQYGRPVDPAAIASNLTLRGLLQRRDPALAAFLGVGSDYHQRRQDEAAARQQQVQKLQQLTAETAAHNAAARHHREQAALNGCDPLTGRPRWAR